MTILGAEALLPLGTVDPAVPTVVDETQALLQAAIRERFAGRIALVSSFGAEAAALLHLVAMVDPATPVVFLDTGKLFGETLRYRDDLVHRLGLTEVRTVRPDMADLAASDGDGTLWLHDPDRCCRLRKVEPLARALSGFDAWINGRKRYHGDGRSALPLVETADGRTKLNPLVRWTSADLEAYFHRHDLPRHPLVEDGYASIGCMLCSAPIRPEDGVRDGRWQGSAKTECGIHLPLPTFQPEEE